MCRGRFGRNCDGGNWSKKKTNVCFPRAPASVPTLQPTMKRVADSQLTKDSEDGDEGSEVNCGYCLSCYPKLTWPLFSQEVGVGFKKAPDPELANRRCALLPHNVRSPLNIVILFQSEAVTQTCIARWERNSSTRQFRTIGGCSRQTRPCIVFLTLNSLPQNPSFPGSLVSDPQQPTRTRLPSAPPLLPQQNFRRNQQQHPPSHQTFRLHHHPQRSPQAPPQLKSSHHLSIQTSMGSRSTPFRLRLLKHVKKRTTTLHSLSIRAFVV